MSNRFKIVLAACAAVLLLQIPLFAGHDHGETHQAGMSCPHMKAMNTSLDEAITLLEQGKTDKASMDKAIAAVKEAKNQMGKCGEMCELATKEGRMKGCCCAGEGHEAATKK
jgi:hypothetical protein